ncbi:SDR family oxidoreductase [Parachitinimonas caeni]|uniref:SDR family oxidoreductase n=1 Tax=Parachitinimonas caeni TaxID=3031301 RepID=A0ABT7DTG5_9NEIS|nr:SDR family oxidoreductase [Parachitinimonas caeni]MDK2123337.1 SDR family oxidoreductase [Parachitinimonas caeni]
MSDWKHYSAPSDLLKDRVIMVTGASQGIGEAAALALARHGATVVLIARTAKKLEKVYDAIEAAGGPQPAAIPFDLKSATDQDYENLANLVWKELGRLDGILHCAHGFSHLSPLLLQKVDEWVEMFRVNVAAPFGLTRACMPLLKRSPDAAVLLVSETHAQAPKAYWGGYAVTKSALSPFLTIAASEWDNLPNLRINMLVPGPVHSPFRTKTHPGESKDSLPSIESLLPGLLYWMGPASTGRSGELIDVAASGQS